ncbi:TetR/AcrR family transcriptional regulator [Marinoscillum furvescens]|uniref:TetR family transcriptional regulator n=1 Tax=Marinoscillum furvescens DSM 4134 TaxID=1122208 RepID=A0A3D9L7Y2_MARFU|nr:TetR/AcrR family transcriptional regulator [Marinoscillum furvescens]REE02192.1 TetR family transcriptional regulator [Marinoscillum furvescens DSM 4134]
MSKEKVLEGALTQFVKYGIRSVSMDDVARGLSMSKKTLYQHFSNKNELVSEAVRKHLNEERSEIEEIVQKSANSIEELFLLAKCLRKHVFKINPSLLFDLQKYHAEGWSVFQEFKKDFIVGQIKSNLERGIAEGYYRSKLNPNILAVLRMELVELAFNDQIFPRSEFDFLEVQMQLFDHFVHGILTESGRKKYTAYQQSESSFKPIDQ